MKHKLLTSIAAGAVVLAGPWAPASATGTVPGSTDEEVLVETASVSADKADLQNAAPREAAALAA